MGNMGTPYERITAYVDQFNAAYKANDTARAIECAERAVREANDELKKPNAFRRDYYVKEVLPAMTAFLANPVIVQAPAQAPVRGGGKGAGTEDKIKGTDWFSSPVPDMGLKDIAGLQDVKDEFIVNVFAPILPAYADIYRKYRGEERGLQVLLYGPPGTGKTHVVRCLAGELGCRIAVVQIKDVMANLVGDGAKIIAEIFEQAKKFDKCIIFFDEIDAIASSREGDDSRHTKEQLTTLLTYMDGFTSKSKPGQIRIVIAATNRPWALDSAVKRGGRFDTQICVPLPDAVARRKLIALALGKDSASKKGVDVPCAEDVTLDWLVERFEGYSGADIKAVCRQAVARPLKREIMAKVKQQDAPDCVKREDFEEVLGRYINSITDDAMIDYDAYRMSMEPGQEYLLTKCEQMILALYNDMKLEKFERTLMISMYRSGFVKENFEKKYDLSFMEAKIAELEKMAVAKR